MRFEDYKRRATEAAECLRGQGMDTVDAVLQCGSGLAALGTELLPEARHIPLSAVPHLPVATVAGHGNEAVYGDVGEATVAVFTGRLHVFEGHSPAEAGFPAAIAAALGARLFISTSSAGALDEEMLAGDVMVHTSYINHQGDNAAACLQFADSAQRFVNPEPAYDPDAARALALALASAGLKVQRGTYLAVRGPIFETDAELRMMRSWGGDAIGMSTVPEVVVCHLLNLPVVGLSVLTNKCLEGNPVSHEEVLAASRAFVPQLARALRLLLVEGRWH